ncbi:MAG: bifunctional folylpolyglutamate synthase/dihydrofolate synthase [Oscillospiraceae bacterium]|nr:bifunctional folylpolyglutamate synthase/dihydrofolate synthase [Oscillospiraceae bacterium]
MKNNEMLQQTAQDWRAVRFGLSRIAQLLHLAGDPHKGMRYVHITGTNGKGSTAVMVANVLQQAGYRTGLFTSPHIQRFGERIKVNGEEIPQHEVDRLSVKLRAWADEMPQRPTEFELYTAMGFIYFAAQQCDVAVLEVGMGGEFDATNIIENTDVAVFTNIGLDHTAYLGSTPLEIAATKAGILKPGCRAVIYEQDAQVVQLLQQRAQALGCDAVVASHAGILPLEQTLGGQRFTYEGTDYEITLTGAHQRQNAATAITVCRQLQQLGYSVTDEDIRAGLANAKWPVRFETVASDPLFIIDGGHNPQCAQTLAETVTALLAGKQIVLLCGMLQDKDYEQTLAILAPLGACAVATAPQSDRALRAEQIAACFAQHGLKAYVQESVADAAALAQQLAGKEGAVICFGSLYLAGEVRTVMGVE